MKHKPPTLPPDKQLPKGVESVLVDSDGHETYVLNPIQDKTQWPGVAIDSSSFDKLSISEKFHNQAIAFLHAAKELSVKAGEDGKSGNSISWPQGSVCYYCINIAVELFLKACITRSGEAAPQTHDLKELLQLYQNILPDPEFQFQIPIQWEIDTSEMEKSLGGKLFTLIDKNPDQFYRYGVGKNGTGSGITHRFVPDVVFNRVMHLKQVWQRAWKEVCKYNG